MKQNLVYSSPIKEIIRVAEKCIEAREFERAMDQLTAAQRMDPDNFYINAIIERIHRLASEESNGGRFLALTIGDEFETGIRPGDNEGKSGEELDARVKKLTSKASELLRRGAYETAFDSLMNAYLLDPVSPAVIESERTLLPAIEMMRKRGTIKEGSQRMNPYDTLPPSGRRPEGATLSADDARRIDELKRQREQERFESERAMWREASRAPHVPETPLLPESTVQEPGAAPLPEKEHTGFFAKLRHGKLLG